MADFFDCIARVVKAGKLTQEQADELTAFQRRHREQLVKQLGPEAAEVEAARAALASADYELQIARRQKALQIIAINDRLAEVGAHEDGFVKGLFALLGRDLRGKAEYSNIDSRSAAYKAIFEGMFAEPMEALRSTRFGLVQDVELARNMVREMFGTASGDARASKFAKTWAEASEFARQQFNAAGGAIPKRADWGMPQWHDAKRVAKVSREQWMDEILPMLDREKMVDAHGLPIPDDEIRTLLSEAYDTISTDGLADLLPGATGGRKLANRRQDHRFLVFKDGDAWLKYHDQFGRQDLFAAMTSHLDGMAQDIARLELMGPSPDATFRYLRDVARKEHGLKGWDLSSLESLWNVTSGKVDPSANLYVADLFTATRNYIASTKLGSAALSAVSDLGFLSTTTHWTGMSPVRTMQRYLKLLNPANEADRAWAVKMYMGADAWTSRALAANRLTEVTGAGFSAKAADFTMRASGLSAMTDAGKKAFSFEFFGSLADPSPELMRVLKNFGLADDDIATMAAHTIEREGAKFLSIESLINSGRLDLAKRILEVKRELQLYAIPEPDARVRAYLTMGASRGTLSGELARAMFQFKSFPLTVTLNLLNQRFNGVGARSKAAYYAQLVTMTTVMGGLALQLKELSKGRDPRDMGDPKFWGSAFLQGGGAGLYGDFLYAGLFGSNRFGQGPLTSLTGPMAGEAEDLVKLTLGNLGQVAAGERANFGAELIRYGQNHIPFLSSGWYTRLAFERMVADQARLMADPRARNQMRTNERKYRKEFGQEYWWRPGQATPDRAPATD